VGEHAAGPAELCEGNGRSGFLYLRVPNHGCSGSSIIAERRLPHPAGRSYSEISGGSRLFLCGDSGQHFIQPPDSRGRRACRVTRRAGWIWLCILQIIQGYAEQRESGPATRHHLSTITRNHQHAEGCEPSGREGGHMHSIVYLIGAVVVIVVVLKLVGLY